MTGILGGGHLFSIMRSNDQRGQLRDCKAPLFPSMYRGEIVASSQQCIDRDVIIYNCR